MTQTRTAAVGCTQTKNKAFPQYWTAQQVVLRYRQMKKHEKKANSGEKNDNTRAESRPGYSAKLTVF